MTNRPYLLDDKETGHIEIKLNSDFFQLFKSKEMQVKFAIQENYSKWVYFFLNCKMKPD